MSINQVPETTREISATVRSALWGVLVCWAIASAVGVTAAWAWGAGWWREAAWISLAGGLLSILSLLPGIVMGDRSDFVAARGMAFLNVCVAASAIRVVGTVALLLVCGYQMHLPLPTVGILIAVNYVFLTAVEVAWLVRGVRQWDDVPADRWTAAGIEESPGFSASRGGGGQS